MKASASTYGAGKRPPPSPQKSATTSGADKRPPPSPQKPDKNPLQSVEFVKDNNGITQLILRNNDASATVSLLGAQVISWKTKVTGELLFLSKKAIVDPPKAVRGGIPICFPEFKNRKTGEDHGFARNRIWVIEENPPHLSGDFKAKVYVDLLLKSSKEDAKIWPHSFEFRLRISLTALGILGLTSRIRNVDKKNFSFCMVYHTYLSVSDICEVRIEGLETQYYLDNLLQKQQFTEQGASLTFESEVDRIYTDCNNVVAVRDHYKKRTVVIRKDGLPDIVVWNPWVKRSKSIADLGDKEYQQMLCVDGAAVEHPITLKPGEEWKGSLELSILLSS
ncbi:hypothetical protein LR48_Vigan401s003500 [Vigna angularis]|uniref:glucose-6-phosphate 1-epimerase n=1 Tax=Phaseolus angularis TaxID=3914 RepID=A0A0L9T936_PHAAN|nr:putative glucose-6-phosphate 1-epimerase [Vigna angularis]KOM27125.1 hypothetical protein LR48_Vigan401s003500 [Vigna angularis]